MEKEGKIKKMVPRDQFGLLSKDDKVKFRDEYLLMTGIRALELRAFNDMIQCYIKN